MMVQTTTRSAAQAGAARARARTVVQATPSGNVLAGLVVVDKPAGWTSHDVVARMRRFANTRRVGHAGTLDPMATGVLVLGIGSATRLLGFVGGADKDYSATIRLGVATVTDDAEGEVISRTDAAHVTEESIARAIRALTGEILQVPSSVSAIKVNGVRSYARVRAGEGVSLQARPANVSRFDVHSQRCGEDHGVGWVDLEVSVTVSSGTYVRALARDLGAALGVGGYLSALRRTRVGGLGLDRAVTLDTLGSLVDSGAPLPIVALADAARDILPCRTVTAAEADDLSHGRRVSRIPADGNPDAEHPIALLGPDGALLALAIVGGEHSLRPSVVFPADTMGEP
jgi:tRNA pseudouridine55 synthase